MYYLKEALPGHEFVIINMDETKLQHDWVQEKGWTTNFPVAKVMTANFKQRVDRAATRAQTTLLAMIISDPALQRHVPQILLPYDTERRPMSAQMRNLLQSYQHPVTYMRGSNGWCTQEVMCDVLTCLRAWMRRYCPGKRLVLMIDAMSAHVTKEVLQMAARYQIFILLIPGSCTWLLQPLDVFVFHLLKERLRSKCLRIKANSENGMVGTFDWIAVVHDAVHEILVNITWDQCFEKVGISTDLLRCSHHLQAFLPDIGSIVPRAWTSAEVDIILGRHRVDLAPLIFSAARISIARRAQLEAGAPPVENG